MYKRRHFPDYNGIGENPTLIKGIDENHGVKDVTFENIFINGKRKENIDGFITNEFSEITVCQN